MNDNNAYSQLRLTCQINVDRRSEIQAVKGAIARLNANTTSRAGRAFFLTAHYLIVIAKSLADELTNQAHITLGDMKKLQDLPDDIQWEFRLANTLGVMEGLNIAGALLNQILEKCRTAMYKASILDLSSETHLALPVHQSGQLDDLYVFAAEAEGRQFEELRAIWQMSSHVSKSVLDDAVRREESQPWTIASVSSNAGNFTAAKLLAGVNATVGSAFNNSPVSLGGKEDYRTSHKIARMKAAAIVSGLISTLLQRNLPWTAINLN